MKFVTVATKSEWYFEYLLQSAQRHKIPLEILGWGDHFQGWMWRLNIIRQYFAKQDPNEIVCFCDAYDVIFLQDASIIEQRFKDMGKRIVVAEDINVDFYSEYVARKLIFGTCKNTRVNAGTYIGYAGDIAWMLQTMCDDHNCDFDKSLDDQKMLTALCQKRPDRIHIDTEQRIFLCICFKTGMQHAGIKIQGGKLLYRGKRDPCILHGAGNANLDGVIAELGYTIKESKFKQSFNIFMLPVIAVMIVLLILFGITLRMTIQACVQHIKK